MKQFILFSIVLGLNLVWTTTHAQVFVDAAASGSGDGTSWTDAYTDLGQAIYDAQSGDELWVAQGTYYPTIDETGATPAIRLRHFWLKDGVKVYGGFNGTEVEFNQRDVQTQKATLDGQIDPSNKAYHVLNVSASSTAKLDGFIVQNGDAGVGSSQGVSNSGGGMYLTGDAQFFNIEFRNNIGYHHGGAVYATGSSALFVNCRFEGNTTTLYDGAAIYLNGSSNINLYNCVIFNNTATRFGGAAVASGTSTLTFRNASIVNNTGSNVYQASTSSTINNNQSTLWGNTTTIGIDSGGGSAVNFTECVYQWAAAGTSINADPLYTNTATGDLTLTAASPAIDFVSTTPYNPYQDLAGNRRIAGASLDAGAYEYGSVAAQLLYVDVDATGANNGTSWADAFNTLEDAIAAGTFSQGEEIWIAEGTYTPHASDRSVYWDIPTGMKLYGGFNGTESLRSERDPSTHIVYLSGDLNGDDNTTILESEPTRADNSYHLFGALGSIADVEIDGVTLTSANANGAGVDQTAAAFRTVHNGADRLIQISFTNVIIEKMTSTQAAIFQNYFYATQGGTTIINFEKSIIRGNVGGGVQGNMRYEGDRTNNQKNYGEINNCLFYDNECTGTGMSAIYNSVTNGNSVVCPMLVTNCTFTENTSGSGYVIAVVRSNDSRYINNIIYNNGSNAPILWNNSGLTSQVFQNCIAEDATFGINQDPLFKDAANDDFRVDCSGNSPAIDGGTSSGVNPLTTDFNGENRIVNTIDIGAYEYQHELTIEASDIILCPGESVTLNAIHATGISWTNGVSNGVPVTPTVTTTYSASGVNENNCADTKNITIDVTIMNDEAVSAAQTTICSGGTTVSIASSTVGESYYLRDDSDNTIIEGPIAGTGSQIDFNTGNLSGTTTFNVLAEKVTSSNPALSFDGVDDYISLGTHTRNFANYATISARVKTTYAGPNRTFIISKYDGSRGIVFFIDANGKAKFDGRDGSGTYKSSGVSTTSVNDGEWHYLTGVVNVTGWHIYVDGVLESSGSYTPGPGLNNATNMRCGNFNTEYADMEIDNLIIWNAALNATQIADIPNQCMDGTESNVVGYYDFNENTGTTLDDKSILNLTGTLANTTPATLWIEGPKNACSSFCEFEMSQTVTVNIGDATAPVADAATLADLTDACQVSVLTAPTATDDCAGAIVGTHSESLPITSSTVVTWTYDDGNGNQSTQTQNVIINDNVAPVADIATLADVTVECEVTTLSAPTATDNCQGTITGTHNASLPISASTVVTWSYDDGNGNIATQTQNVVINDVTAPVVDNATLADVNGQCEVTSLSAPTATDNCAGTITGTHNASLPLTSSTTITWSYDDGSGNITTQNQNVVINDNTAPVANVASLSDVTAQCEVTSLSAPTATDNCDGSITGTHNASLPITSTTVVTWTYEDASGNSSTQTQNVVINDLTAPVADMGSLTTITAQCEVTSLTAPTATDNCEGTIIGTHGESLPITSNTTIVWTYDDGNGNVSTQMQSVVINDNTAPVADAATLNNITAECEVTSLVTPTATDNCSGTVTGTHNASLPITASTTITWTYTDGSGNQSSQIQNVVIDDVTAPVPDLAVLPSINEECEVTSLVNPSATDNCSAVLVSSNASLPISASTTITWTYTDVDGNSTTQDQDIVINDVTAPVADIAALTDVTAQCEVTTLTAPTATDNCEGTIVGTHNASLPISANTVVTWTYVDGSGNASTQTQNVVINDNTNPVPDAAALSDLTDQCEITSLVAPTATDNCSGSITGTHNASLPISSTSTITWSFVDGSGNTITQTQEVIINDATAPVPDNATLTDISQECEVTSLTAPTATDNCSGTITATHNASLPISASTTVVWTYTDNSGNAVTQNQNVVINDVTAPVVDVASLSDVVATCEVNSLTAPTATDNCAGTITGTHNASLPITSNTSVTWTYDDGNGNSVTQVQNVVIYDVDASTTLNGITITANETNADAYQWVDCNNGNAPIAGETGMSFTAIANGSYAVQVTIGSCTETSSCETISTIGIEENSIQDLVIYPNPASSILNIESSYEIVEIIVYDVKGSVVKRTNEKIISVDQLDPGMYHLDILTTTKELHRQFIKN